MNGEPPPAEAHAGCAGKGVPIRQRDTDRIERSPEPSVLRRSASGGLGNRPHAGKRALPQRHTPSTQRNVLDI